MGSGCNQTSYNTCVNPVSSDCVLYQGNPNSSLGICTRDTMTEVVQSLITKFTAFSADASTITTNSLKLSCAGVISALGSNSHTVANILGAFDKYVCSIQSQLSGVITALNITSLDTGCVTPSDSSLYSVLQALLTSYCATKSTVDSLSSTIATTVNESIGTFLNNSLKSCNNYGITKSGSGSGFTATFTGFVPPYCPIAYFGSLSNFDTTGKGLANSSYCGWYLCNGLNGTPDLRGRVLVGSVADIASSAPLDPSVDPTNAANGLANVGYKVNDKFGENFHALNVSEMPSHSHTVNDPGHNHLSGHSPKGWASSGTIGVTNETPTNATTTSTTGITIDSTGSNLRHENRQPSVACAWIMRIS